MKRPCLRCGELTDRGSYCPAHRPRSPSSIAGRTASWPKTRAQALARDDARCTRCGSATDLHVHHVQAVSAGGSNTLANLVTLCEDCHRAEHA